MNCDDPNYSEDNLPADPIADAALDWFVQLQNGRQDPASRAAFEGWFRADPRHAEAFRKVAQIWDLPELRDASLKVKSDLRTRRGAHVGRALWTGPSLKLLSYAAAVASLVIGLYKFTPLSLWLQSDYMTATAEERTIVLPDGSAMTLDAASAVSLDFDHGTRTVHLLKGEAYFDVVHNAARPFHVISQFSQVADVGTSFAVDRKDDEDTIVLERGLVDVNRNAEQHARMRLQPGEIARAKADTLSRVTDANVAEALAWRQGRYIFHEQPLGTVLANLRRYYSGTIFILDAKVGLTPVSGNYRLDDPIGAVQSLAKVAGATMTLLPGGVIILR